MVALYLHSIFVVGDLRWATVQPHSFSPRLKTVLGYYYKSANFSDGCPSFAYAEASRHSFYPFSFDTMSTDIPEFLSDESQTAIVRTASIVSVECHSDDAEQDYSIVFSVCGGPETTTFWRFPTRGARDTVFARLRATLHVETL